MIDLTEFPIRRRVRGVDFQPRMNLRINARHHAAKHALRDALPAAQYSREIPYARQDEFDQEWPKLSKW